MPRTSSLAERRAELDRRLADVLASTDETSLELARAGVQSVPDRWYGQLLALTHDALAPAEAEAGPGPDASAAEPAASSEAEAVMTASTAVELLHGYCRLRGELFVELGADVANSLPSNPSPHLLAGDYLNSAAYAVLGSVDHPRLGDAVDSLFSVSESVACAFDARHGDATDSSGSFFEETAGSLGGGAAVIGATLAGAEDSTRDQFATLGRGFSTARQIQRQLDPETDTHSLAPLDPDPAQLRELGTRRLEAATRVLDDLAATGDVGPLRAFVEDALGGFDSTH
jgi:geranylgeranyl pyrophosphate synthase